MSFVFLRASSIHADDGLQELTVITRAIVLDEFPQRLLVLLQKAGFDLHHVDL